MLQGLYRSRIRRRDQHYFRNRLLLTREPEPYIVWCNQVVCIFFPKAALPEISKIGKFVSIIPVLILFSSYELCFPSDICSICSFMHLLFISLSFLVSFPSNLIPLPTWHLRTLFCALLTLPAYLCHSTSQWRYLFSLWVKEGVLCIVVSHISIR